MKEQIVLMNDELLKSYAETIANRIIEKHNKIKKEKEPKPFLQIKDVCELFSKSRQTIENWTEAGILKKHIISGSVYYLWSEVRSLFEAQKEKNN